MTGSGAGDRLRRYCLHLTASGQPARLVRTGPAQPTAVGLGQPATMAPHLAGLLFPVCPAAHAGAALAAIEAAAQITLSPGQHAARQLLVLAEAVAGGIWRAALTWPPLVGDTPDPAPVKQARACVARLPAALYRGSWRRPGGARLAVDAAALGAAVEALAEAAAWVAAGPRPVAGHAPWTEVVADPTTDPITDSASEPEELCWEETPYARHGGSDRFAAQRDDLQAMTRRLRRAAGAVLDARTDLPSPWSETTTGQGLGVVPTARGRLRHVMALRNGRMTAWRADAPTDWNFAPRGPVVRAAATLGPGADREAGLLVSAFDPCAPCTVANAHISSTEIAHA